MEMEDCIFLFPRPLPLVDSEENYFPQKTVVCNTNQSYINCTIIIIELWINERGRLINELWVNERGSLINELWVNERGSLINELWVNERGSLINELWVNERGSLINELWGSL